jgi:metallo-beta-lactamase family protein
MVRFLKDSRLKIKKVAVVHGEEDQSLAFADFLKAANYDAVVPRVGETLAI